MHIPNEMLQGAICPLTAGLSLAGVTAAAVVATRSEQKPAVARFATVAALIFAGQMVNFPILSGTSGHLLGAALAAALLGPAFAVLAMSLVLAVQALVFGDGGLLTLGANGLNMALIGVAVGWLPHALFDRQAKSQASQRALLTAVGGWLSVMAAALMLSLELAVGGGVPFTQAAGALLGSHAWIGLGEGLLGAALYLVLAPGDERSGKSLAVACAALLASPFASQLPDGLEQAATRLGLAGQSASHLFVPLAGYNMPAVDHAALATLLAGLCGTLLTFGLARLLGGRLLPRAVRPVL